MLVAPLSLPLPFFPTTYLGKGKAKLLSQSNPFFPFTTADSGSGFGMMPTPRTAHDLTHAPNLIHLISAGEQRFQGCDFHGHGTDRPDIHGTRVLTGAQQHLGSSIPPGGHICRIRVLAVGLAGQPEIGDLDIVVGRACRRRRRGRRDQIGVSAQQGGGLRVGITAGRDEDVFGLDVPVEEVVGVDMVQPG